MYAGEFDCRVIIQRDSGTVGGSFNIHTDSWGALATRWAKIEPMGGNEQITAQSQEGIVKHKVTVRYGSDISDLTNKDRLVYGSKTLNIESVINPDEKDVYLVMICKEVT